MSYSKNEETNTHQMSRKDKLNHERSPEPHAEKQTNTSISEDHSRWGVSRKK